MKLRIKGSTIRLRLSQPEVKQIGRGLMVQETVYFGPENILNYLLAPAEDGKMSAIFEKETIKVFIPQKRLNQWCEDENDVGFDFTISHPEGTALYVLVEKDYKCLDVRDEDESDLFENPNAGKDC